MKKKTLCGILSAVMLFSLCPATAMAKDEPLQSFTESIDLREEKNSISGEGWEWDGDDTLTLDDFRAKIPKGVLEDKALFYLPDDATVKIEGEENVIDDRSSGCDVFYCEGKVIFKGDGYMEINVTSSRSSAIYAIEGPVIFQDELEIFVDTSGYLMYVKDAKGTNPIISVTEEALVSFPDDVDNDIITIVRKSKTNSDTTNWFNYQEYYDDWDETINLIPKNAKVVNDKVKPEPEKPIEEIPVEPEKDTYQITIGSPAIVKNGVVSYTSDASPYLSHGYTMLPLRALLNVTYPDLEVKWDAKSKIATAVVDGENVTIPVTTNIYSKGETQFKYYVMPELTDGRLFISLRDWMDLMGIENSQLGWDAKTKTVTLKY